MIEPIVKTLIVTCEAAQAFDVFVARIADWWPLDNHAASAKYGKAALNLTFEPRVGGQLYETMHDGTLDVWGEVQEFDPPNGFVTTWHPGNNKDAPTRLAVTFADMQDGTCRVTLTHIGWEVWAEQAQEMRDNYDRGWDIVFGDRFVSGCGAVVV